MKTSSASSALPPLLLLKLGGQFVTASDMLHERQGRNTGGPSGAMHSSIELRKVVERMCLTTGEMHTFIDMSGGKEGMTDTRKVNADTTHVYATPKMFTTEFVDFILNHYSKEYLFTLTEKEYHHEQYQRES